MMSHEGWLRMHNVPLRDSYDELNEKIVLYTRTQYGYNFRGRYDYLKTKGIENELVYVSIAAEKYPEVNVAWESYKLLLNLIK